MGIGIRRYETTVKKLLILLLLSALPCAAQTYIQSNASDGSSPLTSQFTTQNDAAGNAIIVLETSSEYGDCQYAGNSVGHPVPTDTEGNTFVLLGVNNLGSNVPLCAFAAFNIVGGTKDTVTCYNVNTFGIGCNIVELHGVNSYDSSACTANACIGLLTTPASLATGSCVYNSGPGTFTCSAPSVNTNFTNEMMIGYFGIGHGGDCASGFGAGDVNGSWTSIAAGSDEYQYQLFATTQAGLVVNVNITDGALSCKMATSIFGFYQSSGLSGSKMVGLTRLQ